MNEETELESGLLQRHTNWSRQKSSVVRGSSLRSRNVNRTKTFPSVDTLGVEDSFSFDVDSEGRGTWIAIVESAGTAGQRRLGVQLIEFLLASTLLSPRISEDGKPPFFAWALVLWCLAVTTLNVAFTQRLGLSVGEFLGSISGALGILVMSWLWLSMRRVLREPRVHALYLQLGSELDNGGGSGSTSPRHIFILRATVVTLVLMFVAVIATAVTAFDPRQGLLYYGTKVSLHGLTGGHVIGYIFIGTWHMVNCLHASATLAFVSTVLNLKIGVSVAAERLCGWPKSSLTPSGDLPVPLPVPSSSSSSSLSAAAASDGVFTFNETSGIASLPSPSSSRVAFSVATAADHQRSSNGGEFRELPRKEEEEEEEEEEKAEGEQEEQEEEEEEEDRTLPATRAQRSNTFSGESILPPTVHFAPPLPSSSSPSPPLSSSSLSSPLLSSPASPGAFSGSVGRGARGGVGGSRFDEGMERAGSRVPREVVEERRPPASSAASSSCCRTHSGGASVAGGGGGGVLRLGSSCVSGADACVHTYEDCVELYKALARHVHGVSHLLSPWFLLHCVFTSLEVVVFLYYIATIVIPEPEFLDCTICALYLWTLALPFGACAAISSLGDELRKAVDNARHQPPHPLADRQNKAHFMAYIARNPIGFELRTFAGRSRLDYSLLRFTSAGTVVYVVYNILRIFDD